MPERTLPYRDGTWFAVPLRTAGYGIGVVARCDGKGIVLGYFFGPKALSPPSLAEVCQLPPERAVLIRRFGDLGLLRGEWPIIGHDPHWDRRRWPAPSFGRIALDGQWAVAVQYDEEDIGSVVSERPISVEEARTLPDNGLSGYGAIEIRLTKLLER